MPDLTSLPDEVLKLVMQHVPLQERLTSCCLVNRRLHTAAVAATEQLQLLLSERNCTWQHFISIGTPERGQSVLAWLNHYGEHLTYLKMTSFPTQPVQQLPCPNLQQLVLDGCSVQLGATADGSPGVLQGCRKLTCLELWRCEITDAAAGAVLDGSLSSLVDL
jgi:hypothetical protein